MTMCLSTEETTAIEGLVEESEITADLARQFHERVSAHPEPASMRRTVGHVAMLSIAAVPFIEEGLKAAKG